MSTIQKAVAVIIHDQDNYLIMHKKSDRGSGWWQFVQGKIENNETKIETAIREAKEETGLDIEIEKELNYETDYWFFRKTKIHKFINFILAKADKTKEIKISKEHDNYEWCKSEEVLNKIKFNKEIFKYFIEKHG